MGSVFPLGLRYMAAGALFFSIMTVLVKVAGQRLPTGEIVLARAVITLVLSWLALARRRVPLWGTGTEKRLLVLRGVLGFIALFCFYFAVTRLPLADVTVIHYTNPVFTALLAALLLGETLGGAEVALSLAGLGGVILVARPGFLFGGHVSALDPLGVAAALTGAVFSSGAYTTVRRLGRNQDPMVIVFWFALVSTVASIPAAVPVWTHPRRWEWGVLLGVGVATQLGQVSLTRGLRLERAGRAMAVGYLQIVFAALWGVLFFHEIPDAWGAVGALVIVGSTFLLSRVRRPGKDP